MKIALVFIIVLLVILPALAFTVRGDGVTLKSRIQMFLSFSLSLMQFFLSLLTIFLACSSLSHEVREKFIHLIAVKPIPRWQFLTGKWLGIMVLDAALLAGCGGMIYGFARYLKTLPPVNELDAYGVEQEVFTARAGVKLKPPEAEIAAGVEAAIRQLQQEGRLPVNPDPELEQRTREENRRRLQTEYLTVPPAGGVRVYYFRDLLVNRESDQVLYIRYRGSPGQVPQDEIWHTQWLVGDPELRTRVVLLEQKDPAGRYSTVMVPAACVSEDGTLRVAIRNLDGYAALALTGDEGGMELLYQLGGFGWNFVRALALTYCRLVFLAALGLLMSSFLSFPVACMASLLVFFIGIASGFLTEAIENTAPLGESPALGPLNLTLRMLATGIRWVVPNLSACDPVPAIVDGRAVGLIWIGNTVVQLVVPAFVLGVLASVIFTKRELAQVIV